MKKLLLVNYLLMMFFGSMAVAQEREMFWIGDTVDLGEVQVKSLRFVVREKNAAIPLVVVPTYRIERQAGISVSEIMAREPGLALYRDGAWGTSVSLRGLGENRIVAMVDGCRIETATDLAGGLSMIDQYELDRIEIIKGAASSIYGTGAMGGVLNLITRKGDYRETFGFQGRAAGYFHTVNQLKGTHLELQTGDNKWFARASGGFRQAGNIMTPEGALQNSQFTDYHYNLSAGLKPFRNHELLVQFQDFVAENVGIPGGAPLAAAATATYLEASRRMVNVEYTISPSSEKVSLLKWKYFNQYINREVELLPNMPAVTVGNKRQTVNRITPGGAHHSQGLTFESHFDIANNHLLLLGMDYWQRRVVTTREKYITQEILDDFQMVLKTLELVRGEKPIPDARFASGGLFLQDRISLADGRIEWQTGTRVDGIQVKNDEARDPSYLLLNGQAQDPVPGQRLVFEAQTRFGVSWSFNSSLVWHMNKKQDFMLNAGRSFRSASLEERFKYIDLGSRVRLGDPDLKPEKGWFADLGYRLWGDRILIQSNAFVHYLNDMIVEKPGVFVYNSTDSLPALINTNVDQALLFGYELSARFTVVHNFSLTAKSAYTRGLDLANQGNLPLIAPLNAAVELRYRIADVAALEWTSMYVAPQNKIASGETATPGFTVSGISMVSEEKTLGKAAFRVIAGVDNLFNAKYRNHLSTNRGVILTEPGRNVFVKLEMRF